MGIKNLHIGKSDGRLNIQYEIDTTDVLPKTFMDPVIDKVVPNKVIS